MYNRNNMRFASGHLTTVVAPIEDVSYYLIRVTEKNATFHVKTALIS